MRGALVSTRPDYHCLSIIITLSVTYKFIVINIMILLLLLIVAALVLVVVGCGAIILAFACAWTVYRSITSSQKRFQFPYLIWSRP